MKKAIFTLAIGDNQNPMYRAALMSFERYADRVGAYFNYLLHRDGLKHESVSPEFNRMDALGEEGYRDASFIHYAGRGYANSTLKRDTRYCNDFCDLFDGIIDTGTPEEIRQAGWDVFVDKAQRRYKLPRPVVEMLARKFVTI